MPLALPHNIRPTGPEQKPLQELLNQAFTEDDLDRLVKYRLNLAPKNLYATRDPFYVRLTHLMEKVDTESRWGEFLLLVCLEKPTNTLLLNVCCGLARLPLPEWQRCVRCRLLAESLGMGFDLPVLQRMVENKLAKDKLAALRREPFEEFAFALAELIVGDDLTNVEVTKHVVREGLRIFPEHPMLRGFGGYFFPNDLQAWLTEPHEVDKQLADSARQAVQSVRDVCQTQPAFRTIIIGLHPDLKAITTQSNRLGSIKTLHDSLHQLVVEYLGQLPDLSDRVEMPDSRIELADLCDRLKTEFIPRFKKFQTNPLLSAISLNWISELEDVEKAWSQTLRTNSPPAKLREALQDVYDDIERVTSRELFKINVRLVDGAREYKIDELLRVLASIKNALSQGGLAADSLLQIEVGFNDLANLNFKLQVLINQHDHWQKFEHELQNASLDDLRVARRDWQRLARSGQTYFQLSPPWWLALVQEQIQKLEAALDAGALAGLEEPARHIQKLVHMRFLQVDRDLKEYFEPLSSAVNSLSSLLTV